MFRPNSTWWLSSTFHVVVSFAFVTCFAALGPLACDLVSWRNLIPYPLWSRNSVFSGINLKTPYLANTGLHLTSLAIQIQKFPLPWPHVCREEQQSQRQVGWLKWGPWPPTSGWALLLVLSMPPPPTQAEPLTGACLSPGDGRFWSRNIEAVSTTVLQREVPLLILQIWAFHKPLCEWEAYIWN